MFLSNFSSHLQETQDFVNREDIKAPTGDGLRNRKFLDLSEDLVLHD